LKFYALLAFYIKPGMSVTEKESMSCLRFS